MYHPVIGMAQDFVGSNNINLLIPSGQFGTRLAGGDDAASSRYIFTYLSPIARYLFPEADDTLLTYREDDGQLIEPEFYCPIIPLLLVNGSQGIGTGWSTFVPSYHPLDVINYIRAKLDQETNLPPIRPYARGFTGEIEPHPKGNGFVTFGRATKKDERTVVIDELPLGSWTNTYKNVLMALREKGAIVNFIEDHTTTKVSFTVKFKGLQLSRMERTGLATALKLKTNLQTGNMHAFDVSYVMRKYDTPEDIANEFFSVRLKLYEDRKSVLESEMSYSASLLRNKAKFIQSIVASEIDLMSGRRSKEETIVRLDELGFARKSELQAIRNDNEPYRRKQLNRPITTPVEHEITDDYGEFDYLLNMQLSSLTKEKITSLIEEAMKTEAELERTKATSARDLWTYDLSELTKRL
jgi:DNA topoisomerase II